MARAPIAPVAPGEAPAVGSAGTYSRSRLAIQLMSDSQERYNLVHDEQKRTLVLSRRGDPNGKTTLVYRQPRPDVLFVEGPFDGHNVQARLRRTEPPKFLLVTRGFRWINERPVNR